MSFAETSQNLFIVDGVFLNADALMADQETWVANQINLNDFIGNMDGSFVWEGQNFGETAANVRLDGVFLIADLQMDNGEWVESSIDLNERISNEDGRLFFQ